MNVLILVNYKMLLMLVLYHQIVMVLLIHKWDLEAENLPELILVLGGINSENLQL